MRAFYRSEGTTGPLNPAKSVDKFAKNDVRAEALSDETLDTRRAEPRIITILGWIMCLAIALYFPVLLRITLI